jgi:hypothetical protein
MIIYALDALLFLFVQDYLGVGFHIFVLFLIAGGFRANRMLPENAIYSGRQTFPGLSNL